MRLLVLLCLSMFLLSAPGCARWSRKTSRQPNMPAGHARVGGLDSAVEDDALNSKPVVGVKSNSATEIATITNGSGAVDGDLEQASVDGAEGEKGTDANAQEIASSEKTEVAPPQRKGAPVALRRLFNWGGNTNPQTEDKAKEVAEQTKADEADKTEKQASDDKAETNKIVARTRGRRLLAMLGLDWGKDEPLVESDEEADVDSPATAVDTVADAKSAETEGVEQELTNLSAKESAEETAQPLFESPRSNVVRQTSGDDEPALLHSKGAIPLPVGGSNRALQTPQSSEGGQDDEQRDEEPPANPTDDSDVSEDQLSLDEAQSSARTLQAGEDLLAAKARRSSRQMAMRQAMLPGKSQLNSGVLDTPGEVREASSAPAAVVSIPNRLELPKPKPVAESWEMQSVKEWLPIAGLAVAGLCIVGAGLWRRLRKPSKSPPSRGRRKLFSKPPKSQA